MTEAIHKNIELAVKDVEHAFRLWEFSIRVMNYCELEELDLGTFGQDIVIQLDKGNVTFCDSYFSSSENTILISQISVGAAFGATAITLDNLLEATDCPRDPKSKDEFQMLWILIYSVRNAFAHGIAKPVWVVKKSYQQCIEFTLGGDKIDINLAALDKQSFEYDHIGGPVGWIAIKDRVLTLVQQNKIALGPT